MKRAHRASWRILTEVPFLAPLLRKYFFRPTWGDIEYFDDAWRLRIRRMAEWIPQKATVLDLGCGPMWLKAFLPPEVQYIGCDYRARGADVIVCDLNRGEFPETTADICFVSGCLEYIEDVDWLLGRIRAAAPVLLLSYCARDLHPDLRVRKSRAWVNHLYRSELVAKVERAGFRVEDTCSDVEGQILFRFSAKPA